MVNLYFLPEWYIEKYKKRKIKLLKIAIIIFFTLDLILIDILIFNRNKMIADDSKIQEKILTKNKLNEKNKSNKKRSITLDTLLEFEENMPKDVSLESINIENKKIDFKFQSSSENLNTIIKAIESTNKFNINYIEIPYEESKEHIVKSGLELK